MNAIPNTLQRLVAPNMLSTVGDREIKVVVATQDVARDGNVLVIEGIDLTNYRLNPVVLWGHDGMQPIAKCTSIEVVGETLQATVSFPPVGTSDTADEVLRMVKTGVINAVSIGWIPTAAVPLNGGRGWKFTASDMLEFSIVSVGSDPNALVIERDFIHKVEDHAARRREAAMALRSADQEARSLAQALRPADQEAHSLGQILRVAPRFASLAENLLAIARSSRDCAPDARLTRAPTVAGEADPTSGGFLVEPVFAQELIQSLYAEAVIAPLCDRRTTSKPLAETSIPGIDETSRADGSRNGGVLAYWASEASSVAGTFPRFRRVSFSAKKLLAILFGSGELMSDAPMFDAWVRSAFASEMGFKLDAAILAGTGAGTPLGILSSSALITVEKDSGQAAGTITLGNISGMWGSMAAPCRRRAVWLVNEDVEQLLDTVGIGTGPGNAGIYLPAGANGNPVPLLKGRPVYVVEQAPTLGAAGDIILADLSQYIIVDGGLDFTLSVHVQFDSDQVVWRFVLRVDGNPAWCSPITPYNGSASRSPFVALGARR